jgi:hypothetical protein
MDVAGRKMTGYGGDTPVYLPRNARCTLGTLTASK